MSNFISGAIAVTLALVYLLYYAIRLKSGVLWIIILLNIGFMVFDFYKSMKEGEDHI
ncbi:hypothetical protein D3OALGA1CA_1753 [Olavius algarvensis associated proteobacterium Delta 3]|nr:hypothetical protein D3OALGA1CA_1753 [Olavius algarvensis associated proteobacterium Delta 3]CAB5128930.1 hypothetical protein D3OALGB2SA_3483 [Olavius algarvensis associated proteobacterium Delta 3]